MFNTELFSLHLHLYYYEPSKTLLEKLAPVWDSKLYLSIVENNDDNNNILSCARSLFKEVIVSENPNKGNDQYGFYKSFQMNKDESHWIFFAHDKHIDKLSWMNELIDPLVRNTRFINYLARQEDVGLIAANTEKHTSRQYVEEELNSIGEVCSHDERIKVIKSKQTLIWLRELQRILIKQNNLTQIHDPNALTFIAGNMFIIRRNILEKCHNCLHENFFSNYYTEDGDVGHGLERFYFYAPLCLSYNIQLVGEKAND